MSVQDKITELSERLGRSIEQPMGTCPPGTGAFMVRGVFDQMFEEGLDVRDLFADHEEQPEGWTTGAGFAPR